eukprot:CAMPEP_0114529604 /NCGR_PEP_ID=MMETSP0109-20121206/24945_1 /TAXON_ID=29199 /ORGANISM="Chlorarachnion reptans, Strain CCCM449" /LENGTH=299 /DNA_ID=CAMNT_0001712061 /DNA_START=57 /DNA_END=956 /DNA_ORIENTATION=+
MTFRLGKSNPRPRRFSSPEMSASHDVERYRQGYPGLQDNPEADRNLMFYQGKIKSEPMGDLIDNIHKEWHGDYKRLEIHHGYIQWLFPIREMGMNWDSQPLQKFEANKIKASPELMERFIRSYRLMLDFYGMVLENESTGKIKRGSNYRDRYDNLENRAHNWLRITRILKCMGELGLEHYKIKFIRHVLREFWENELRQCFQSLKNYWIPVIKSKDEREKIYAYFEELRARNEEKGETKGKKENGQQSGKEQSGKEQSGKEHQHSDDANAQKSTSEKQQEADRSQEQSSSESAPEKQTG